MPLGTEVGLGPGHIVLDWDTVRLSYYYRPRRHCVRWESAPHGKAHSSLPHFLAHFTVARSPISATAELLFDHLLPFSVL